MMPESFIMWFILLGFLLGKKLPLNKDDLLKWWYNRRGIPWYLVYILEGGKIIHRGLIKHDALTFSYDKGKYVTSAKDASGRAYTPYIELNELKIIFYHKGNTNPLEFRDSYFTPSHNNPETFQTIIEDNSIRQALSGEIDISELKRFILIALIVSCSAIAGIMYFLGRM
jgi:hypothetical protein